MYMFYVKQHTWQIPLDFYEAIWSWDESSAGLLVLPGLNMKHGIMLYLNRRKMPQTTRQKAHCICRLLLLCQTEYQMVSEEQINNVMRRILFICYYSRENILRYWTYTIPCTSMLNLLTFSDMTAGSMPAPSCICQNTYPNSQKQPELEIKLNHLPSSTNAINSKQISLIQAQIY